MFDLAGVKGESIVKCHQRHFQRCMGDSCCVTARTSTREACITTSLTRCQEGSHDECYPGLAMDGCGPVTHFDLERCIWENVWRMSVFGRTNTLVHPARLGYQSYIRTSRRFRHQDKAFLMEKSGGGVYLDFHVSFTPSHPRQFHTVSPFFSVEIDPKALSSTELLTCTNMCPL